MRLSLLLPFVLATVLVPSAVGQPPVAPPSFEVRTNLLVLDDKNQYVTGLRSSDVHVYQDGIEQKLTGFAERQLPLSLSFVVDNSGSVREQLDDVIKLTKTIIANTADSDEAQIIRFVGRDHIEIIQKWTNTKKDLNEAADNMYIEGGQTALTDALYLATKDILDRRKLLPQRRYVIVLISDGEDRASYYTRKDMLKQLMSADIEVFTVALLKDLGKSTGLVNGFRRVSIADVERLSNDLAALSGGTSYFVRRKLTNNDLKSDLLSLFVELRAQYSITYTTDLAEPRSRKLTVAVANGPNGEMRKGILKETIVLPAVKK